MPQQAQQQQVPISTAHLTCLCGDVKEPGALLQPSSAAKAFPVSSHMCHCNTCRWMTGNLLVSCPALTAAPSMASLARCTTYASSPQFSRYFCSRCGCHCFVQDVSQKTSPSSGSEVEEVEWYANAGIIERDPAQIQPDEVWAEDLVTTAEHYYIADTVDGSILPRLSTLGGIDIPLYMGPPGDQSLKTSVDEVLRLGADRNAKSTPEDLKAECRCGSISFSIRRPNYAVDDQGVPPRHIGRDKTKYPAYFCACRYDRAGTGAWFVQPWTYVPPSNITFTDHDEDSNLTKTTTLSEIFHTTASTTSRSSSATAISSRMTHYRSSHDSTRSFCSTCGATVFYMNDGRPSLANVAVGILRADEGALARDWLEWVWGRVVCPEYATERILLEALMKPGGEPGE